MKRFLLILVFPFYGITFGQSEQVLYKTVADNFEKNYNDENFNRIFLDFSTEMQSALPFEKTKEFLTGLRIQVGKITKRAFIKYEQTYASYKTDFERGVFTVDISIDSSSKINGLFVKPFEESNLPKIIRNSTKLILPFKNEWTVVWGGDTKDLNYHIESVAQKKAFLV